MDCGQENLVHYLRINNNWKVIIGDGLFQKTFPKKLTKGKLTILVEDAAYAYHLRYFRKRILDLIASPEICGENIVWDIEFFVGPLPTWKSISTKTPPKTKVPILRKKRTDYRSQKTSSKIKNSNLRNSFSRFMFRVSSKVEDKNE